MPRSLDEAIQEAAERSGVMGPDPRPTEAAPPAAPPPVPANTPAPGEYSTGADDFVYTVGSDGKLTLGAGMPGGVEIPRDSVPYQAVVAQIKSGALKPRKAPVQAQ